MDSQAARGSVMGARVKFKILRLFIASSLVLLHFFLAAQDLPKNIFVSIKAQEGSIYSILAEVSRQTGFFFVYDNQVIDNSKLVRVGDTESEMFSFVRSLIPERVVNFRVVGQHILIFEAPKAPVLKPKPIIDPDLEKPDTTWFVVSGTIFDGDTGQRLPFASVGIADQGLGISTNLDGFFRLRVPYSLSDDMLSVYYLGYKTKEVPLKLLINNNIDIFLETDVIELQEVVIRDYDPILVVRKMLDNKGRNFSDRPVYHYNFYREGVSRNEKLINYSEAIFKIYKESFFQGRRDQVKVLRGRNIENAANTDTLVLKLKAGVQSTLELDIMKEPPDFLQDDYMGEYYYRNAGFSTRDGRSAYAIEFEQRREIRKPLFKGVLYIDTEDYAIIEAEFEVNPRFIADAGSLFFIGWKREYVPNMKKAIYHVRYQKHRDHYHVHHIRGELEMSVGTRRGGSYNTYSAFFETVVVKIEDQNVRRFPRREIIRPNTIFVDQGFEDDEEFWGEFSIITPEASVIDAFTGIRARIESFLEE